MFTSCKLWQIIFDLILSFFFFFFSQSQTNTGQDYTVDASFFDQLQQLHMVQELFLKKQEANEPKSSVKFDKKLLDFDYGEEEEDDVVVTNSPNAATSANTQHNAISTNNSLGSLGLLLTNPEVCIKY